MQIRIDQLQQDVETKERFIQTYSQTIQAREQHIEKLLDDIQTVRYSEEISLFVFCFY
jgi:cell division protein FtsB